MIQLIQKKIETFYRLNEFPEANQYLLSNAQLSLFEQNPSPQVVFQESEEDVLLGIYLGEKIQTNLQKPIKTFSFQDFCVMAEEVSHYIYLVWSKSNGKKLHLLDLEVQGEIDKFFLAKEIYKSHDRSFERIFSEFSLREDLTNEARNRYIEANRLAKKLVQHLGKKKLSKTKTFDWLRYFYRQNSEHRMSIIECGLH